jgi:hypothetical protein
MFLGIATWQIEQTGIIKVWHFCLRIEKRNVPETIDILLIDKGERLLVPRYDEPSSELCPLTTAGMQGFRKSEQLPPIDVLLQKMIEILTIDCFREIES